MNVLMCTAVMLHVGMHVRRARVFAAHHLCQFSKQPMQVLAPLTPQHDITSPPYGSALGKHHAAAYELQRPRCPAGSYYE